MHAHAVVAICCLPEFFFCLTRNSTVTYDVMSSPTLCATSLNGTLVARRCVVETRLFALLWSEDGQSLLVGGMSKLVLVLDAYTLDVVLRIGSRNTPLVAYDERRTLSDHSGLPLLPRVASSTAEEGGETHRSRSQHPRSSRQARAHKPRHDRMHSKSVRPGRRSHDDKRHALAPIEEFKAPITSLMLTQHERELLVGLADGTVATFAPDGLYCIVQIDGQLRGMGFI